MSASTNEKKIYSIICDYACYNRDEKLMEACLERLLNLGGLSATSVISFRAKIAMFLTTARKKLLGNDDSTSFLDLRAQFHQLMPEIVNRDSWSKFNEISFKLGMFHIIELLRDDENDFDDDFDWDEYLERIDDVLPEKSLEDERGLTSSASPSKDLVGVMMEERRRCLAVFETLSLAERQAKIISLVWSYKIPEFLSFTDSFLEEIENETLPRPVLEGLVGVMPSSAPATGEYHGNTGVKRSSRKKRSAVKKLARTSLELLKSINDYNKAEDGSDTDFDFAAPEVLNGEVPKRSPPKQKKQKMQKKSSSKPASIGSSRAGSPVKSPSRRPPSPPKSSKKKVDSSLSAAREKLNSSSKAIPDPLNDAITGVVSTTRVNGRSPGSKRSFVHAPSRNSRATALLASQDTMEDFEVTSAAPALPTPATKRKYPDLEVEGDVAPSSAKKGRTRRFWTSEQEKLLTEAVGEYGTSWATIESMYPQFKRWEKSQVNMKDKWRNLMKKKKVE